MRALDAAALAALKSRAVCLRDFLWIVARDRDTGAPVAAGFWSDLGTVSAQVLNPETGGPEFRTFEGGGNLIEISAIPLVANLTVQNVTVTASQLSNINDLVRAYDLKQARVEIYRGLFTPATLNQLAPAFPRFVGFVDEVEINTPAEGDAGSITLTCVSNSQEMGRSNPATRSDGYMQQRSAGDTFRRHAATVGTWELKWGTG